MRLGAHQSIAGGLEKAIERVQNIGGNTLQIFSCSPRTWKSADVSNESVEIFKQKLKQSKIRPVFFHACYLINLADSGITAQRSLKSLIDELKLAKKLGVTGSVVHIGSYKTKNEGVYDYKKIKTEQYHILLKNIEYVLNHTPQNTSLILENSGSKKIGYDICELGKIIKDVKDKRVKVCLDTCHLHAAGYDITTKEELDRFFERFDTAVGMERLEVIHINDSKDPRGSFRDRHENIGEGKIGLSAFANLLNYKKLKNIPFIMETPGFDKKGPDKKNLNILKKLANI